MHRETQHISFFRRSANHGPMKISDEPSKNGKVKDVGFQNSKISTTKNYFQFYNFFRTLMCNLRTSVRIFNLRKLHKSNFSQTIAESQIWRWNPKMRKGPI